MGRTRFHHRVVRLERAEALESRTRELDPRVHGDPAREREHAEPTMPVGGIGK